MNAADKPVTVQAPTPERATVDPSIAAFAKRMQTVEAFAASKARLEAGIEAGKLPELTSDDQAALLELALAGRIGIPRENSTAAWARKVWIIG